jgi:homoserine kinase
MEWPESLAFVVLTPDVPLTTQDSRAVLPDCLLRKDVVFNLQRVALLLRSLQSEDFSLMKMAMSDRVHQPARLKIVPGLAQALQLEHDDLLGVCLSGSGPSIAAMAESNLPEVGRLLASVYDPLRIDYQLRTLRVHRAASQQPAKLFRSGLLCS